MREPWRFVNCALFGVCAIFTVTNTHAGVSHRSENQSTRVRVYALDEGVAAPDLLPAKLPTDLMVSCELKVDGTVYLSFLVDSAGVPHNLTFIQPVGSDLDELALQIVSEDRFTPGTLGSVPVVVAESVEMTLRTCLVPVQGENGQKTYKLRLRAMPEQKFVTMQHPPKDASFTQVTAFDSAIDRKASPAERVRGRIVAPVPIHSVEVKMLSQRQRSRFQQSCLISVIIDSHGMPIEPKVLRGLNPALDLEAWEAVRSRRFRPATQDGRPIAMRIAMEVDFLFY